MSILRYLIPTATRAMFLFCIGLTTLGVAQTATYWVSPAGTAAWSSCTGSTPLNGTSACSLATANANATAGNLVYLRGGTYTVAAAYGVAFGNGATGSGNSGTSASAMIDFWAYPGETPVITNSSGGTAYAIFFDNSQNYISIRGMTFSGSGWDWPSYWFIIRNGSSHNEIAFNTFTTPTGGGQARIASWTGGAPWPTNNWIHNNQFIKAGSGCTDGGTDTLDIGYEGGTFGATTDQSNYNTVENNVFDHDQHAAFDNWGEYNVLRNNVFHNEPWSVDSCAAAPYVASYSTGTATYSASTTYAMGNTVSWGGNDYVSLQNSNTGQALTNTAYWMNLGAFSTFLPNYTSYNGNYAHRNFQIDDDYGNAGTPPRTATYVLVEGNRSGYAGVNQANDGPDDFDLAAPGNIVRFNFFYAAMNTGLMFKYGWGGGIGNGGNGGTYNRVYNNTFYLNGYGYPLGLTPGCSVGNDSCPWAEAAITTYAGANSGVGNVLKNNLIYQSSGYAIYGLDVIDKGNDGSAWGEMSGPLGTGGASNNWCTGAQTSTSGSLTGCSAYGNPLFNNPDITNPASTTLPDLSLQSGSGALNGGTYLTTATNSGAPSTTLTVADAMYFQDGTWGSDLARPAAGLGGTMQADWIAIGSVTNTVQISAVSYGAYNSPAGTITLASPMTWSSGAPIWLYSKSDGVNVLSGSAPNYGAGMQASGGSLLAAPTGLTATVN